MLLGHVEQLIEAVDRNGWGVAFGFLGNEDSMRLKDECEVAWEQGEFRKAGVGRGEGLQIREEIRRDQVMWLERGAFSEEQEIYLATLEKLRLALNQRFFLGLMEFEGHFAIYPEGAFYKAHLDRHAGTSDRIVTVILYLNPDWQPGDGGELCIWTKPGEREGPCTLIEPRLGTLVCFMAGDFWHEVLPATKTRMSITGWFSTGGQGVR